MISTSTASCSSPRPWTSHVSGRSVSTTRSETLPTSSCVEARLRTWRAVSFEPSLPASGEVLMPIVIDSDGSSTVITGSGRGSSGSASVSPIVTSGRPATAMISPGPGLLGVDAVERLGHVELGRPGRALDGAVGAAPGDLLALADRPVAHAADREAADVGRGVEVRDERLQRMVGLVLGAGMRSTQQVHQRREVLGDGRPAPRATRSRPGVAVDDRELDLVLVGVEVEEQLVDLVDDLGDRARPGGRPCSRRGSPGAGARAPCAARSASAAAAPRWRRRAAARRRPSSARARPRRRSRRGRACRRC